MQTGIGRKLGFIAYQAIAWTLIALCVWMIYGFSQQDGLESESLSLEVADVAAVILHPGVGIDRDTQAFERLHLYVRKGAHALEYALLALAGMMMLAPFRMRPLKKMLMVLILCAAFAGYDEWSQAASLGRTPAVRDVGIDSGGALLGCVFAMMVRQMVLWDIRFRMRGRSPQK